MNSLALYGGTPYINYSLPQRQQFGESEKLAVNNVFNHYARKNIDFGAQGYFENQYCSDFIKFQQEAGWADAVNSGTNGIYVALSALQLPKEANILISPITDPGSVAPIILLGLTPKVIDYDTNSYYSTLDNVQSRCDKNTQAIILTHLWGKVNPHIEKICNWAKENNIFVIEDCSQVHGAKYNNKKAGTFGDIAVFSTMHTKNHSSGSNGGIIFTKNKKLFSKIRAYSDRGKNFLDPQFNPKDPKKLLFPALNFNQDELSSAIGIQSLKKLPQVNQTRISLIQNLINSLTNSSLFTPYEISNNDAPYYWPIKFDFDDHIKITKAIQAEGVDINPHYPYLVTTWPAYTKYYYDKFLPIQAKKFINNSFNLLFNEFYTPNDMQNVANALLKIETLLI